MSSALGLVAVVWGGQNYTSTAPSGSASRIEGPAASSVRLLYAGSGRWLVLDGFGPLYAL